MIWADTTQVVAETLFDLDSGGGSYTEAADRYLYTRASTIAGGTTEMARNVISERVLGMPRERTLDRDVPFRELQLGVRRQS